MLFLVVTKIIAKNATQHTSKLLTKLKDIICDLGVEQAICFWKCTFFNWEKYNP